MKTYNVMDCGLNNMASDKVGEPSGLELEIQPKSAHRIRGARTSLCLDPYVQPTRPRSETKGQAGSGVTITDNVVAKAWVMFLGGLAMAVVVNVLVGVPATALYAGLGTVILLGLIVTVK